MNEIIVLSACSAASCEVAVLLLRVLDLPFKLLQILLQNHLWGFSCLLKSIKVDFVQLFAVSMNNLGAESRVELPGEGVEQRPFSLQR